MINVYIRVHFFLSVSVDLAPVFFFSVVGSLWSTARPIVLTYVHSMNVIGFLELVVFFL